MQVTKKEMNQILDMAVDAVDFYRALLVLRSDVDKAVELLKNAGKAGEADMLAANADAILSDRAGMRARFDALAQEGLVGLPEEAAKAMEVVKKVRMSMQVKGNQ